VLTFLGSLLCCEAMIAAYDEHLIAIAIVFQAFGKFIFFVTV